MKRFLGLLNAILILGLLAGGCGTPTPGVVEKIVTQVVKETVVVESAPEVVEKVVEKVVTQVVEPSPTPMPPTTSKEEIEAVINDFNSTDADRADGAYEKLFSMGVNAIEPLLDNLEHTGLFAGSAWVNPNSSVAIYAPTTGRVALYLVEAIIQSEQVPHFLPCLISTDDRDDELLFEEAKQLYQHWWSDYQEDILAGQEVRHPLTDTGIFWY